MDDTKVILKKLQGICKYQYKRIHNITLSINPIFFNGYDVEVCGLDKNGLKIGITFQIDCLEEVDPANMIIEQIERSGLFNE